MPDLGALDPDPAQRGPAPPPKSKAPIPDFKIGSKAVTSPRSVLQRGQAGDPFAADPVRMDKKAYDRLKRGKGRPEGKIDLHGKTVDAARSALTAYVMRAAADGKRLILVVTGKGHWRPDTDVIPGRVGILRQSLPQWVASPPLSSVVLQATPAHQRHGGSGAFYLYLRRMR